MNKIIHHLISSVELSVAFTDPGGGISDEFQDPRPTAHLILGQMSIAQIHLLPEERVRGTILLDNEFFWDNWVEAGKDHQRVGLGITGGRTHWGRLEVSTGLVVWHEGDRRRVLWLPTWISSRLQEFLDLGVYDDDLGG